MKKIINKHLRGLGISAHLLGFNFIREAVLLCLEDEKRLFAITKEIYPEIAKRYTTSASKVERDIRHAKTTGIKRCDNAQLREYFGSVICNGNISNSEFLGTIYENIKTEIEEER